MHLSAGLDIPAIGLFGDTPLSYANYNKNIFPIIPKNLKIFNSEGINKKSIKLSNKNKIEKELSEEKPIMTIL